MASPGARVHWEWSSKLGAWYLYDASRNVYVTEDGRTFQSPATQRPQEPRDALLPSEQRSRDLVTGGVRDRTGSTGSGAQYGIASGADPGLSDTSNSLNGMMNDMRISDPGSTATVRRGFNQVQRIETRVQISPPEGITQPELFEQGFTAHAKVLQTTGDREKLDPGKDCFSETTLSI